MVNMISLTRHDGRVVEINPSWIGLIDQDGFGNGSWIDYNDGKQTGKIHVKETLAEVRKKMQGVGVK